jgi:predicted nuclease with TOPRIM domain
MAYKYARQKSIPLTEEEIRQKYEEVQEEMQEVLEWKKESEANLENVKSSPQKKGAAKRALKKIARRIDTVQGQIIYWKNRIKGESHFKANIEKNEYWASCREKSGLIKNK